MTVLKKILSVMMIAALIAGVVVMSAVTVGATGTGVGLAEWAMRAYNEGWSYVWGGDSVGAVDCSGMITSYCGGNRTSMLSDAQAHGRDWGYVSDGIPNIHGLGLSRPNHVGVYVGNGMEVDARGDDYGVCYQAVGSRWNCWFKLTAVTYPTTGWQKFNGNYYYYENGEYLADTSRTIDGVTYYFASSGISSQTPSDTSAKSNTKTTTTAPAQTTPTQTTSAATPAADDGPLKLGSTGERVEKLQERLQELGYYDGYVDGDFGEMTETAFMLFQKQAGLYEDGIAGSDADILFASNAPSYVPLRLTTGKKTTVETGSNEPDAAEDDQEAEYDAEDTDADEPEEPAVMRYANGDSSDEVAKIQQQLIQLGYLNGNADGIFGSMTEAAVKEFQSANQLNGTGVVDEATYTVLFSAAAVKHTGSITTIGAESTEPTPAESIAATTAKDTTVERDNAALSQKSVAVVSDTVSARNDSATNLEFIVWLGIMIVVMIIAFIIVFMIEKKRARAMAYAGRRYQ